MVRQLTQWGEVDWKETLSIIWLIKNVPSPPGLMSSIFLGLIFSGIAGVPSSSKETINSLFWKLSLIATFPFLSL